MDSKRFQHRKIIKAVRPSEKFTKTNKQQHVYNSDSKCIKRKKSEEFETNYKRLKNVTADEIPIKNYTSSTTLSRNIANQRLQKLRNSLAENQKKMESCSQLSQNNDRCKANSNKSKQSYGSFVNYETNIHRKLQDRITMKSKHNITNPTTVSYLNRSLPSSSKVTNHSNVFERINLNNTPPTKVNKRDSFMAFSPFLNSTPSKFNNSSLFNNKSYRNSFDQNVTRNNTSSNFSEDMEWSSVHEEHVIENVSGISL